MGWREKELQKHKMRKMIEQIMNMPEYKEAKKKDEVQYVLRAMLKIAYITLIWLEMNFRCKRNGFCKFLDFLKGTMEDIESDTDFFKDSNTYYKEKYDLDVMKYLGLEFDEDEKS